MSLTLSRLCERSWRDLGMSKDITATGGSTTSVVDTNTPFTTDNTYVGGSVLVTRDAGGLNAAPEGEFGRISAFSASSKTFTMDAVSVAVASGDSIMLASPKIPLTQMIQAANDGLRDLGYIRALDVSLSTVGGQVEYTLPVALKTGDLVDILLEASDSIPRSIKGDCRFDPSSPGTTSSLWIPDQFADETIHIIYNGYHPKLTAFSSVVAEVIPETLAVAATINAALNWLVGKRGDSALGTFLLQRKNEAAQVLSNAKIEHPMYRTPRKPRWFSVHDQGHYIGDQSIYQRED